MDRIRIVLANVPRLLRDLVEHLVEEQTDMVVVGDLAAQPAVERQPARAPFDVVLVATTDERLPPAYVDLLYAWPRTRIVTITESRRDAALFELHPSRTPLGNASPDALLAAIRSAAHEGLT